MRLSIILIISLFVNPAVQSGDALVNKFLSQIPKNWTYKISSTSLELYRTDSVYAIFHNKINECGNCPEDIKEDENRAKNYKTLGKKVRAEVVYRLEAYWKEGKKAEADKHNNAVTKKINELPKKYKITHLYDKFASHKGVPTYTGETKDEKKRIKEYEAERSKLEKTYKPYPDYQSQNYALFLVKNVGCDDQYTDYFPIEVSKECYTILNIAQEVFKRL